MFYSYQKKNDNKFFINDEVKLFKNNLIHGSRANVETLEIISKDKIDNDSLDYHQWLADVVIELINEYYLRDAKAS